MSAERKPLLSDEQVSGDWEHPDVLEGVKYARDFYEAKITSGELMVVKTCTYDRGGCLTCGNVDDHGTQWRGWKHCPGCGAKIIEP